MPVNLMKMKIKKKPRPQPKHRIKIASKNNNIEFLVWTQTHLGKKALKAQFNFSICFNIFLLFCNIFKLCS